MNNIIVYTHTRLIILHNYLLCKTFNMQSVTLKPFVCSECGKGYSRNYRLQKHLEEEHHVTTTVKRSRRFKCPMCPEKSFFMFLEMKRHCEGEHQNDLGTYIIT